MESAILRGAKARNGKAFGPIIFTICELDATSILALFDPDHFREIGALYSTEKRVVNGRFEI
jgi:hypothetical protein